MLRAVPLILLTLLAAGDASRAPDETGPGALFRRAFAEGPLRHAERVRLLERIAKEHGDSEWADDAVWVLGEAARRKERLERVIYYWQFLLGRWPGARLEDYTRSLQVYRDSPMPAIDSILRAEGQGYVRRQEPVIEDSGGSIHLLRNAQRFNALPMTVWTELAECYRRLDRPRLALRCYRQALRAAPSGGSLRRRCQQNVERLEGYVEAMPPLEPVRQVQGSADVAAPETGPRPSRRGGAPESRDAATRANSPGGAGQGD